MGGRRRRERATRGGVGRATRIENIRAAVQASRTEIVNFRISLTNVAECRAMRKLHAAHGWHRVPRGSRVAAHGLAVGKIPEIHLACMVDPGPFPDGGLETLGIPVVERLTDTPRNRLGVVPEDDTHRLRSLMAGSVTASLSLQLSLRLGLAAIAADRGQNLNVRDLSQAVVVNLRFELPDDAHDRLRAVSGAASLQEPVGHGSAVQDGIIGIVFFRLMLI